MMLSQSSSFADENATTNHMNVKSNNGASTAKTPMKKTAFTPCTKQQQTTNTKRRAFGDISNRKGAAPLTTEGKSVSFQQTKSAVKIKTKKSAKKAAVKTPFANKKSPHNRIANVEMIATRPFDPFFDDGDSDKENWMVSLNQLTLDSTKKQNKRRTHRRRNRAETLVNLDEFLAVAHMEMDDVSLMVAPDDLYSLPSSRIDLSIVEDDADHASAFSICDISF